MGCLTKNTLFIEKSIYPNDITIIPTDFTGHIKGMFVTKHRQISSAPADLPSLNIIQLTSLELQKKETQLKGNTRTNKTNLD